MIGSLQAQAAVAYQARLQRIKQMLQTKNVRFSNSVEEHERLKEEVMQQMYQCLVKIDQAQMLAEQKIALSDEVERYFYNIINNDAVQMENKKNLIVKKMQAVKMLMQQKLKSKMLTKSQYDKIEEYKKQKAKKKTIRNTLLILAAILLAITVVGCVLFLWGKSRDKLRDRQIEENTDSEWRKQEDIINGANKHKSNDAFTDDLAKQLLGNDTSTIKELRNDGGVKEFTVTTGEKTTYYQYDKLTDTLMSKSTADATYIKIDKGDNYLANYFASDGGVIVYDKTGLEKMVKIGNDTYQYDYNNEDIIKNDVTKYTRFQNGTPDFVKITDSQYTKAMYAGFGAAGILAIAGIGVGCSPVGDDDKVIESWIKDDEKLQDDKRDMQRSYDNIVSTGIDDGTVIGGIGANAGTKFGQALQNLQASFNNFNMRGDVNNLGRITDLDVNMLAENGNLINN